MKAFWRNKRILLTGFNGFKGSWMTLMLSSLGAKVYGYSLKDYNGIRNNKIFKLEKNCKKFCYGNILEYKKLLNFYKKTKPDIIIHMASQSLVGEAYKSPKKTFKVNSEGLLNILDASLKLKNNNIIFVLTSDKCYFNDEKKVAFKENDKLLGEDPYSASKSVQEIICYSYSKSFSLNIATARAGNVIGGGDFTNLRIVPDIIKTIFENKKIFIRNLSATRPWQHVLDINLNYIKFIEKFYRKKKVLSGPWNFGPNNSYSVKKIVSFFKNKKKFKYKEIKPVFREKKYLQLSNKKLEKKLKIKTKINFFETLNMTYDWYYNYYNKKNLYNNQALNNF